MLRLLVASLVLAAAAGCTHSDRAHLGSAQEQIAVCARAEDGVWCSRWSGQGFLAGTRWSADFGYGTAVAADDDAFLTPDLDGDGRSDICLRQAAGLLCALRATPDSFGPTIHSDYFADRDGFARWSATATLAFGDVDGDGLVDACARQPSALFCARGHGDGHFDAPVAWLTTPFGDGDDSACSASMRLGDIDGDGAADVCVSCADGVRCALARGDHFTPPMLRAAAFADDGVSGHDGFFELVDIDGDRRLDVCGRQGSEVRCMTSDGSRFSPGPLLTGIGDGEVARFADIDGDGRADICLFNRNGSRCATALSGFTLRPWDTQPFDGTAERPLPLELLDVDGDGHADRCELDPAGLSCARSNGEQFSHDVAPVRFASAAGADDDALDLTTTTLGARTQPGASRSNRIVRENQQPGAEDWWVPYPQWSMSREVEAYLDRLSYAPGQTVNIMLSTSTSGDVVRWRVLRTGWYGGRGARQLLDGSVFGHPQPAPRVVDNRTPVRAGWTPTFSFAVPADAVSGVYVLRLDSQSANKSFFVTFVVRDDAHPAELLFNRADFTDEAYNDWDGGANVSSAYRGAVYVSFDRPLRSVAGLAVYSYSSGYFMYEYPLVRWLEKEGYDVAYVSDFDVHSGIDLTRATAFMSAGHNEYWSATMRDNVEGARDRGLNLAFFGSDAVDGLIRFKHGDPRTFSRTISDQDLHKNEFSAKPINSKRPPHDNPADTLIGTHYVGWCSATHPQCANGDPLGKLRVADDFHVLAPGHPIFRGIDSAQPLHQVVGYEYEGTIADTGPLPFALSVLAATDGLRIDPQPVMVAYRAMSGAQVVNLGSMHWAHTLDPWTGNASLRTTGGERPCQSGESDCFTRHELAAAQITANILTDLGLVPATPSPALRPTVRQRWP